MHAHTRWTLVLACALLPLAATAQATPPATAPAAPQAATAAVASLKPVPAAASLAARDAAVLGAAWAGSRAVTVGDHGTVLLSDDQGAGWRQAKSVPVSSKLTAVAFADAQRGWAVGHWGAILATTDGGETWTVQRLKTDEDRPLLAVHFFDAGHGVAVGLWSLVLTTADGGQTWTAQTLPPMARSRKADLNLIGLFADPRGTVYATAEQGQLLRSADQGQTWQYLDTGYKGSLWAGAALADGSLLVGGQRGTLMRSADGGASWERLPLQGRSSVTAMSVRDQQVTVVGLDGLLARSSDGCKTFRIDNRPDGLSLTAVLARPGGGQPLLFSRRGVAAQASPQAAAPAATPATGSTANAKTVN